MNFIGRFAFGELAAYLQAHTQALDCRTLLRLVGQEPPPLEELRTQTQHQTALRFSRLPGPTARKTLNTF